MKDVDQEYNGTDMTQLVMFIHNDEANVLDSKETAKKFVLLILADRLCFETMCIYSNLCNLHHIFSGILILCSLLNINFKHPKLKKLPVAMHCLGHGRPYCCPNFCLENSFMNMIHIKHIQL